MDNEFSEMCTSAKVTRIEQREVAESILEDLIGYTKGRTMNHGNNGTLWRGEPENTYASRKENGSALQSRQSHSI